MPALHDLATPVLLVDVDVVRRNVERMALRMVDAGVGLRPHMKTHKCREIAALQVEAGCSGFTVATPREARQMIAWGHTDVTLAFPFVGGPRRAELRELLDRADVTFVLDSQVGAEAVGALAGAGRSVRCLWEIDCGTGRCGTPTGSASVDAAAAAAGVAGVDLRGWFTFAGHAYKAGTLADVVAVADAEDEALATTAALGADRGLARDVLSAGSSPTAAHVREGRKATEMRPGTYVFNDMTQVALGSATLDDCALTVLGTVVSRPACDRAIVDVGSKALGREQLAPNMTNGLGGIKAHPELRVDQLYEEHGLITLGPDAPRLGVGERVEILPNHACVTANLHDAYTVRRGDEIVDRWAIGARGWG